MGRRAGHARVPSDLTTQAGSMDSNISKTGHWGGVQRLRPSADPLSQNLHCIMMPRLLLCSSSLRSTALVPKRQGWVRTPWWGIW